MDRQFNETIGSRDNGTRWFTLTFLASKMERAMKGEEEWEKVCWDECVRRCHARKLVPIGPVLITDEDVERPSPKLKEGARLIPDAVSLVGPIFKVTCQVELGQSEDWVAPETEIKSLEGIDTDGLTEEDIAWLESL